jgi:hypothetical protein
MGDSNSNNVRHTNPNKLEVSHLLTHMPVTLVVLLEVPW